MDNASSTLRQDVAWLQPVRWATCGLLWAVAAVLVAFPHLDLSLREIRGLGLTAAICRTSLAWAAHRRHASPAALLALALAADAALLTGLLDITGGPFNPFIVMYAVYVWVAAGAMAPAWTIPVALVSLAGFGWLVVDHLRAGLLEHHRLNDFPTHLFAMWFCGAGVVELVAVYVTRARTLLAQRQTELDTARERAVRSERMASLTTLAAGAAHELSTPLATIAVAAGELEHNAAKVTDPAPVGAALRDDASLIRRELERCQSILDGMSGRAGTGLPAMLQPMTPLAITQVVRQRLTEARRQQLTVEIAPNTPTPAATGAEIMQAISSLLRNAFDASGAAGPVTLRFGVRDRMVRIEVEDRGPGMSAEDIRRAGEPFYTTKEPGRGLGLGLFLVRAFAERSGGSLEFESAGGTIARVEVPALENADARP